MSQLTFIDRGGSGSALLRFGNSRDPDTAYAFYPSEWSFGGDVWFGPLISSTPVTGSYDFLTIAHEIGHALGLKHGHESDGERTAVLPGSRDSSEYSIMTYRSYVGHDLRASPFLTAKNGSFAQSLMRSDIAAIQALYGANFAAESGDTTYSFSETTGQFFVNGISRGTLAANKIFRTIWDGGGRDTYDFSNFSGGTTIDLSPGNGSILDRNLLAELDFRDANNRASANVYNAWLYKGDTRSLIENARGGAGADLIVGNQADNFLWGNGGADTLIGAAGDDNLFGGNGDDDLAGGAGSDWLDGGAGTNSVRFAFAQSSYRLSLTATANLTVRGVGEALSEGIDTLVNVTFVWFQSVRVTFASLLQSLANVPPTDLVLTGGSVIENAPAGTAVGRIHAVDPTVGETFRYELLSATSGLPYDARSGSMRRRERFRSQKVRQSTLSARRSTPWSLV